MNVGAPSLNESSPLSLAIYGSVVAFFLGLGLIMPWPEYLVLVTILSFAHHFQGVYRIARYGGGVASSEVQRKIFLVAGYLALASVLYIAFGQQVSLVVSWTIGTLHYFLDSHYLCKSPLKTTSLITGFLIILLQVNQAYGFKIFDVGPMGVALIALGLLQLVHAHRHNHVTGRMTTYAEYELGLVSIFFGTIVMVLNPERVPYLFNMLALLHILNWYYSLHFHTLKKNRVHFASYYKETFFFIGLFAAGYFLYAAIDRRESSPLHLIYNPLFLSVWLNAHIAATFQPQRLTPLLPRWRAT